MFIRQVEEDERKARQSRSADSPRARASRSTGASPRRAAGTSASPTQQPRRHVVQVEGTMEPEPELRGFAATQQPRVSMAAPAPKSQTAKKKHTKAHHIATSVSATQIKVKGTSAAC